jgi:hypothetical protein
VLHPYGVGGWQEDLQAWLRVLSRPGINGPPTGKRPGETAHLLPVEKPLSPCRTRPAKEFMLLLSKRRQISIESALKRALFPLHVALDLQTDQHLSCEYLAVALFSPFNSDGNLAPLTTRCLCRLNACPGVCPE